MRIAFREWRLRWDLVEDMPLLQSTYMPSLWYEDGLKADISPENEHGVGMYSELHGVHACLPWCGSMFLSQVRSASPVRLIVFGAVDLIGHVVEHTDGVVRAEEVRILALRVVDLSYGLECNHSDFLVVRGPICGLYKGGNEGRNIGAVRRRCFPASSWGCNGWFRRHGLIDETPNSLLFWAEEQPPPEVLRTVELDQLTSLLCQRYEVPRLGESEGPWKPPLGAGPELEVVT